jgi:Fe-S cluster biosynthesis and repair protein YggX|tara:strand:- start:1102 stop:1395 length:294 start_codon:yes stop_codon:yes gene_type:complete
MTASDGPRLVQCVKLQKELPGLDEPPWPGDLGKKIFEKVSAEAWKMWEERMKMILNENRLMPWQKEAQELVAKQMEDFFFGDGSALPPDYVPEQAKG